MKNLPQGLCARVVVQHLGSRYVRHSSKLALSGHGRKALGGHAPTPLHVASVSLKGRPRGKSVSTSYPRPKASAPARALLRSEDVNALAHAYPYSNVEVANDLSEMRPEDYHSAPVDKARRWTWYSVALPQRRRWPGSASPALLARRGFEHLEAQHPSDGVKDLHRRRKTTPCRRPLPRCAGVLPRPAACGTAAPRSPRHWSRRRGATTGPLACQSGEPG